MAEIIIPITNEILAIILLIFSSISALWTVYQEYRHKRNNGTIKPHKPSPQIKIITEDLEIIKDHIRSIDPNKFQ